MNRTLYQSSKYKGFIQDRNRALEQINIHAQTDISRILFEALDSITGFVSHMALSHELTVSHLHFLTKQLDAYIDSKFGPTLIQLERRIKRMRRATYTLTYISELEAIARATQRVTHLDPYKFKIKLGQQERSRMLLDQNLDQRIWQGLTRLKHKIIQAFQGGLVREESPLEIVNAVKKTYPTIVVYKKPPRALKPIREADQKKGEKEFDFYSGLTDGEDWDLAVQAYLDTEIPPSRFDNSPSFDEETGTRRYNWEIEQDVTDDFVKQVREGQVQAANDLGIKDGVWVAIIDKKTCDVCCLPRNGKTSSEIEEMLKSGELDADACDSSVPPGHPFCRCDWAPVASTDEVEGPDWKSFSEWLES